MHTLPTCLRRQRRANTESRQLQCLEPGAKGTQIQGGWPSMEGQAAVYEEEEVGFVGRFCGERGDVHEGWSAS